MPSGSLEPAAALSLGVSGALPEVGLAEIAAVGSRLVTVTVTVRRRTTIGIGHPHRHHVRADAVERRVSSYPSRRRTPRRRRGPTRRSTQSRPGHWSRRPEATPTSGALPEVGLAEIAAVGSRLVTVTVTDFVAAPPSASVTRTVTTCGPTPLNVARRQTRRVVERPVVVEVPRVGQRSPVRVTGAGGTEARRERCVARGGVGRDRRRRLPVGRRCRRRRVVATPSPTAPCRVTRTRHHVRADAVERRARRRPDASSNAPSSSRSQS